MIFLNLNVQHHARIIFDSDFIDPHPLEAIVFEIVFQIDATLRGLNTKEALKERGALICGRLNTVARDAPKAMRILSNREEISQPQENLVNLDCKCAIR